MGQIRVKVKLTNAIDEEMARTGKLPREQVRSYEADEMVDTGAVRSVIPQHVLQMVGATIRSNRVAEYADGRTESVGLT